MRLCRAPIIYKLTNELRWGGKQVSVLKRGYVR